MKKAFLSLLVLTILSCSKKNQGDTLNPAGNCAKLTEAYSSAVVNYIEDQSPKNCTAYLKALDDLVNKCTVLTGELKREYQEQRTNLKCD